MKYLVISEYASHYPNPIKFQVGDVVQIGDIDNEFPGWVWVTTYDGNQGWAPIQFLQIDDKNKTGISLQNYSACELNTKIGDQLILLQELNGWAWVENDRNEHGWVPSNTIESIIK